MWKHIIYNPMMNNLAEVMAQNVDMNGMVTLRWVVPVSMYEVVLIFGPPPIQYTSNPLPFTLTYTTPTFSG